MSQIDEVNASLEILDMALPERTFEGLSSSEKVKFTLEQQQNIYQKIEEVEAAFFIQGVNPNCYPGSPNWEACKGTYRRRILDTLKIILAQDDLGNISASERINKVIEIMEEIYKQMPQIDIISTVKIEEIRERQVLRRNLGTIYFEPGN